MDGIHDIGGKQGFGAIELEADPLPFKERWQGAVFTMVNSLFFSGALHNTDQFRHAVERIDPVSYLTDGYYGRWLGGAETTLIEAGQLSQGELTTRATELGAPPQARIAARPSASPDQFPAHATAERGANAARAVAASAQFQIGDAVETASTPVSGHTRLPAYARGAVGTVVACHGGWVYPDSNAHGQGEQPCHLYTVAFPSAVLWGEAGEPDLEVCLDLFEPYLTAV